MPEADGRAALPPADPIYRESAEALKSLPHDEMLSWMHTLLEVRTLGATAERS